VAVPGREDIIEWPTAIAIQTGPRGRSVLCVGEQARRMVGRTPAGTRVIRPVRGGVVSDFEATERLLRHLLREVGVGLLRPRVLMCVPSETSEMERRAVRDSARAAGAREVFVAPAAIAAALGAGLPVADPVGSMIIDVGAGRTEVAILSLGGVVVQRSIRIAGDAMDEAISRALQKSHGLAIGDRTRETLKIRLGGALPAPRPLQMRVRGRSVADGSPREIDVTSDQVTASVQGCVQRIRDLAVDALRATPPDLAADILDRGIILCGGASQLRDLDTVLREATGLPILHAEHPTWCSALGTRSLLADAELFSRVAVVA
jgi:rod shape-determining protein MreB and related proteins